MLSREGAGPDGTGVEPMKRILVFVNDPAFLMGITKTEKLFDEFLCYYASFPVRAVGVHLIWGSLDFGIAAHGHSSLEAVYARADAESAGISGGGQGSVGRRI